MSSNAGRWESSSRAPNAVLTLPTFRLLAGLLAGHSGIVLSDELLPKVERRLRARLFAVGANSFEDYYRHLKYRDPERREMTHVAELLTVQETYFFREMKQLQIFRDTILPELRRQKTKSGQRSLRIWSAGCSTGEEAYTIAMLIGGAQLFGNWDVQVIGTDLSRRAIDSAREAVYPQSSFRATPNEYLAFFDAVGENQFRVRERFRKMCRFVPNNLAQQSDRPFLTNVDVVFCRNVLIYLSLPVRKAIVEVFYSALRPGGRLLLGHSESLLNTSEAFQVDAFQDALTYRRPPLAASSNPPRSSTRGRSDSW